MDRKMLEEGKEKLLRNVYGGDENALNASIKRGRSQTIQWTDIEASAKTHPEFETDVTKLSLILLGYLPPAHLMLPHTGFLQTYYHQYKNGYLTMDELLEQSETHLKLVRNKILKEHNSIFVDKAYTELYKTYLPEVATRAKDRLFYFLGYTPHLETSIRAELMMRQALIDDAYTFTENIIGSVDMQAITIIKYREVLLDKGLQAAKKSPLVARQIVADFIVRLDTKK